MTASDTMSLAIALEGPDNRALLEAAFATGRFGTGLPDRLRVEGKKLSRIPKDWLAQYGGGSMTAVWGDADFTVSNSFGELPKVQAKVFPRSAEVVADLLSTLPFTIASFQSIHLDWYDGRYNATGFGGLHFPHGVMCAFRAEGHRRLVSRRWLDHGPWRTVRAAGDTTLVQFHDLAADSPEALAQARPGHDRMGFSDEGGFIPPQHEYEAGLEGRYYPAERRQRIMAAMRQVSPREMLDACAARLEQKWGADRPSEHVGFLFLEEGLARRHMHELWLRELECWTIVGGKETRIDEGYVPPPHEPPAWAR
jgi:hypothetical protein